VPGRIRTVKLGKRFRRYRADRPRSAKEAFLRGLRGIRSSETFWALRNVDLEIGPGRMLGIIGHNGAGKSTLLQLICGVGRLDEGSVETRGRVAGLLELGAGFHPDLTGRENVLVSGVIAGLTRSEVLHRFDSIVEFAELASFIDSPLRTYSQGMRLRLGFAIATHTEPEVLVIDEMLAVGDRRFRRKCLDRIAEFKSTGCAIAIASHDLNSVREHCDEAIQLRHGEIVARGASEAVARQYEEEQHAPLTELGE
jgi:lipopolysaccharide transport system ATP-binding protein